MSYAEWRLKQGLRRSYLPSMRPRRFPNANCRTYSVVFPWMCRQWRPRDAWKDYDPDR